MCWLDAEEVWVSSAFVCVHVLEWERNSDGGGDKWGRVGESEMPSTLSRRSIRPIAFSVLIIFFMLNVRLNRHSLWRKNNYRFQEGILYIYRGENGTAATHRAKDEMCLCVCLKYVCERGQKISTASGKGNGEPKEAVLLSEKWRKKHEKQQNTRSLKSENGTRNVTFQNLIEYKFRKHGAP